MQTLLRNGIFIILYSVLTHRTFFLGRTIRKNVVVEGNVNNCFRLLGSRVVLWFEVLTSGRVDSGRIEQKKLHFFCSTRVQLQLKLAFNPIFKPALSAILGSG